MIAFAKRVPLRRTARGLSDEAALAVLRRTTWGVLSTTGPDGAPYGTPINHVLDERGPKPRLLFHTAPAGRRLDNLRHRPEASFVAVDGAETLPDKFSTAYQSAIAEGPVEIVEDPEAKREALRFFVATLAPDFTQRGEKHIAHRLHECLVLSLTIEYLCGKGREKREPYALEHLGF